MTIKLALPAGDSRPLVGELLAGAGVTTTGYEPSSRQLRSVLHEDGLTLRVFREKDIPIQVALGNYDIGITSDVWLSELQVRFPLQRIVRIGSLPGPRTEVWIAASLDSGASPEMLPAPGLLEGARIASELPNLSDVAAVQMRIPRYRLLPVHGSADAYPPDDAEFAVLSVAGREQVEAKGLVALHRLFSGGLAVLANADSLRSKPLGGLLAKLAPLLSGDAPVLDVPRPGAGGTFRRQERSYDVLRLAVPDGHAQRHIPAALLAGGMRFDGYDEKSFVRRPLSGLDGLEVKVVRPQDMPQMVAMGMFDIAVSGVDILHEHKCKFPSSPVQMQVDLGRNRYWIGPVVDAAFPAQTTAEAIPIWNALGRPVRIASEFPATAERFAHDHQIHHTAIIPVAGASEGFVPEDADFLVEGTETGTSIRANGLKMLDAFMESTACVVTRREPVTRRSALLADVVQRFETSARAVAVS